jgi:predicted  nucleic acid-binding Zn-ribbon protein
MNIRLIAGIAILSLSPSVLLAQAIPDEVDHARYQTILQSIEVKLQDAQAKLQALESERTQIRSELQLMTAQRRDLPNTNNQLEAQIAANQQRDAELTSEIASIQVTVQRIGQDIQRLENEVASLYSSYQQEMARRNQIDNNLRSVDADARRLRDQLDREIREENQSIALLNRIENEISQLQVRRQQLAEEHRARQAAHQRDQRELPQLRRQQTQIASQLQTARTQLESSERVLASAQGQLTQAEAELARLNREIAPIERTVTQARAAFQKAQADVDKVTKEIQDARATIKNLEQRKVTANQQLRTLESARIAQVRELTDAQVALDKATSEASEATLKLQNDNKALQDAQAELRAATQRGATRSEIAAIQARIRNLETVVRQSQQAAANASRVAAAARTSVEQKENVVKATDTQIATNKAFLASVDSDIATAQASINTNSSRLTALNNTLQTAKTNLTQAEADLAAVSGGRDRAAQQVNRLKQTVAQSTTQRNQQAAVVQNLQTQNQNLTQQIRQTEQAIAGYGRDIQRLEAQAAVYARDIQQKTTEANRERQLLARIRQDRVAIQQQIAYADQTLQNLSRDLADQDYRVRSIEETLNQRQTERNQLASYRDESQQLANAHAQEQAQLRQAVTNANRQIQENSARLTAIDRQLPVLQNRLSQLTEEIPTVTDQIATLETQVSQASAQYQQRLSLFQRYLGEATQLGAQRGNVKGLTDGAAAGTAEQIAAATKLATPVASEEGRFEAILRGFVRGEIAGFNLGRTQGLASQADADRGVREGTLAGAREAKDYAEQVLKPAFYETEFERRLKDPTVRDEVVMKMAALASADETVNTKSLLEVSIPVSPSELAESRTIVTSLDERIEAAIKEIARLKQDQSRLSSPEQIYLAPATVNPRVDNKTCEGVYKNLASFVKACQDSYKVDYTEQYLLAHKTEFMQGYTPSFLSAVERIREGVLNRDYKAQRAQAEQVAKAVGLSAGRAEIYQERFASSRIQSYHSNLVNEEARVKDEATQMVDELFAANGVVSLNEIPELVSNSEYGVSPGTDINVSMLLKNAGAKATSEGAVKVRIIEVSPNLIVTRNVAPIKSLPARKIIKTNADFGLKVRDEAPAGSKVRLVAEISYPGHEYTAQRTEKIEIEEVLGVNPAALVDVSYDSNPSATGFLGRTLVHGVTVSVTAKHAGMSQGYEVSMEEVGTSFASYNDQRAQTAKLDRGVTGKATLRYKMTKSARGKEIQFKIVTKYNGKVIDEQMMKIKAK